MKEQPHDLQVDKTRFTGEPDCTASEASPGAHDLPPLAPADMVGLVHHVGWPVEILKQKKAGSDWVRLRQTKVVLLNCLLQ